MPFRSYSAYFFWYALFFFCSPPLASASTVDGRVLDKMGHGLGYVSVYLQGTTQGTITNEKGRFTLELAPGKQRLTFSCLGYTTQSITLMIGAEPLHPLVVHLVETTYSISEVVISIGNSNPANRIMKRASSRRGFFDHQVTGFRCRVYSKGLQRLVSAPTSILGTDIHGSLSRLGLDSGKRGILYLSEAVSTLKFKKPATYSEEILSSRISGNPQGFTFNQASGSVVDFNHSIVSLRGLSLSEFISPMAGNAPQFYRFILVGKDKGPDGLVDKIRVIPKNSHTRTFSGCIYIAEPSYQLVGVDLSLSRSVGLEVIDSVAIVQNFIHLKGDTAVLASEHFMVEGGLFKFKFKGFFDLVFSSYQLNPVWKTNDFNAVQIRIIPKANLKDSAYWSRIRPVPLSDEEKTDYHRKDSLYLVHKTPKYLDSTDRIDHKISGLDLFLTGLSIHHTARRSTLFVNPLLSLVQYNTVEGLVINPILGYEKKVSDTAYYRFEAKGRFGWGSSSLQGSLDFLGMMNAKKNMYLRIGAGSEVQDFNALGAIQPFFNTFQTLVNQLNILKLYENRFIQGGFGTRIFPGLYGYSSVEWARRIPLVNTSYGHFGSIPNRPFTANNPAGGMGNDPAFSAYTGLYWNLKLDLRIGEKYLDRPEGLFIVSSPYPKLQFRYSRGISNLLGSGADFDFLSLKVHDEHKKWGPWINLNYRAEYGEFLRARQLQFIDAHHFINNTSTLTPLPGNPYLILNPYSYTSFKHYSEAHVENNFGGALLNFIPGVRLFKLHEVLGFSVLQSDDRPLYSEIYVGINRLGITFSYLITLKNGAIDQHSIALTSSF